MAPSCAVNPAPTVAVSPIAATSGEISRVFEVGRDERGERGGADLVQPRVGLQPTTAPVNEVSSATMITVPPTSANPPAPKVTSVRMRRTSFL